MIRSRRTGSRLLAYSRSQVSPTPAASLPPGRMSGSRTLGPAIVAVTRERSGVLVVHGVWADEWSSSEARQEFPSWGPSQTPHAPAHLTAQGIPATEQVFRSGGPGYRTVTRNLAGVWVDQRPGVRRLVKRHRHRLRCWRGRPGRPHGPLIGARRPPSLPAASSRGCLPPTARLRNSINSCCRQGLILA